MSSHLRTTAALTDTTDIALPDAAHYAAKWTAHNHIALRCPNPTMTGMHTNRHHASLSFCVKALRKGIYESSLFGMDACQNERLLEEGAVASKHTSRAFPDCFFPTGTGSSGWNQSHPNAVFVNSSQASLTTLILRISRLLRSFLKTGTFILLSLNAALIPTPFTLKKLQLPSMPAV
eukprot:1143354-Pelagomonas_calceolata.AAC.7